MGVIHQSPAAAAVFCQDAPQIFDMHLPPAQRVVARDRIIAERKMSAPDTYAPFTIDEYRRMPLDYAFIDECVRWPALAAGATPLAFAGTRPPQVPVLVISGEFDNMTSVADGAAAAAQFSRARHIVIANSFHVNALPRARTACGATLVRRFMSELAVEDEHCAASVPPLTLVPRFARAVHELDPAQALAGHEAGEEALRVVSATLLTCADVMTRAAEAGMGPGIGLRGGTFTVARRDAGYRLTLHQVRWTDDLAVSGNLDLTGSRGGARADLELQTSQGPGELQLTWPQGMSEAHIDARGTLGGKVVAAQALPP